MVALRMQSFGAFGPAAACALGLCAAARGGLTAHEPFEYGPQGTLLLGQSGGGSFGFGSDWQAGGFNAFTNDNFTVEPESLTFGNLLTSGGRVHAGSANVLTGLTRDFSAPLGAVGTTRYYSFLLRPEGTLHSGLFAGFFGLNLESPGEPELFTGKPGGGQLGRYVMEDRGGGSQVASPLSAVVDKTAFFVVKADFRQGNDLFTLYANPTPGLPEPVTGTTKSVFMGTASGFTLYSTGEFSIDELRLGTTFADVTPVTPEPAAAACLAAIAPLLLARRRRRHSGPADHGNRM